MGRSLFHIVAEPVWREACQTGQYAPESLYEEGFIHCSFAEQVESVARRLYPDVTGLIVVEFDEDLLSAPVELESAAGSLEAFPHVYGPIDTVAQIGERPMAPGAGAGPPR